jgi:hypothetical protein
VYSWGQDARIDSMKNPGRGAAGIMVDRDSPVKRVLGVAQTLKRGG